MKECVVVRGFTNHEKTYQIGDIIKVTEIQEINLKAENFITDVKIYNKVMKDVEKCKKLIKKQ